MYYFACHKTHPALIAIKAIDKLLQWRRVHKVRLAFIDSQLIEALITCSFFAVEALFRACCAYEHVLWSDVLDRTAAGAGLHDVKAHGVTCFEGSERDEFKALIPFEAMVPYSLNQSACLTQSPM
ncbi:hypothetical protein ASF84_14425 [Pseudomonas sp. Leaf127]|nr:hypothetical protein ASF84_14425 [Pseudomonas sp. Leaf127]